MIKNYVILFKMNGKKTQKKYVIGVDLGGTKILSAIVDRSGKIVERVNLPTEAALGPKRVIGNIRDSVNLLLAKSGIPLSQIKAIGIGAPGPILYEKGVVLDPPNLPGWKRVPVRDLVQKEFKVPVILENDANAAALAESRSGAAKNCENFIYLTISTGIGGGIVIGRKLYRGSIGGAGEVGHMIIKTDGPMCGCGNPGCLEAMASGSAIGRLGREAAAGNKSSLMVKLAGGDLKKINALTVELAAKKGDAPAKKVLNEAAFNLGVGLANLINIFAPDMIALGGGVINMGEMFLGPARRTAKRFSLSPAGDHVKIIAVKLGGDVGVLGAAALCLE